MPTGWGTDVRVLPNRKDASRWHTLVSAGITITATKKLCRRRPQTVRRARKGQRRPEEHRHSRGQKVQKFVGDRILLGVKKTPTTGRFGFARVWNLGSKRPVANHWGLKRPQEAGTEFARNHSGSLETKAPPRRCGPQPKWPPPEEARRGSSKPEEAGIHTKPQRNEIRAKPQREHGNEGPAPRVRRCGRQPKWPPQKRPEEATRGRNSRETTQREHRNATEFARSHSGSIETQRNSRESTAGASKPRPRPTARRCGQQPNKWPAQKRPEEATRGRNSRETTAGASKCNGIRAKPQRQHRNATEFARNHSGSIEMQRNSRETTAGASKRNGIRAKPQRERRNQGPVPPRVPLRSATYKWPPEKRPEEATRQAGIRVEMQRTSRETTVGASKRNGIPRNHSGSVETKAPSHRARRCGRQPKWPPQKRLEEATRGRNSRETTGGASKCNGIRAKPQREHRNATEFARNHSGSVETKAPSHRRARRCGQQPIPLP